MPACSFHSRIAHALSNIPPWLMSSYIDRSQLSCHENKFISCGEDSSSTGVASSSVASRSVPSSGIGTASAFGS
eukprot:5106131-Pyramimonas_sp.AAC.1